MSSDGVMYSSTDTGAPVLSRSVGSLITVLKAVLVNGYGGKDPLGWTIEYEDAPNRVCVFRPQLGVRPFIQIADNAAIDYGRANVKVFMAMSDAYNGVEPLFPINSSIEIPCLVKEYGTTSDSTAIPWSIIGNSYGMWFLPTWKAVTSAGTAGDRKTISPQYLGDYIPLDISNSYNFCSILPNGYSSYKVYSHLAGLLYGSVTSAYSSVYCMRDKGLGIGGVKSSLFLLNNDNYQSLGNHYAGSDGVSISPMNGRYIYTPVFIQTAVQILGIIPGLCDLLYVPPNPLTENDVLSYVITNGSASQFIFSSTYSNQAWNIVSVAHRCIINLGSRYKYAL